MEPNLPPTEEVLALCDRLIDGQFTAEDKARLELLVREHPAARRAYVEYMHLHANLNWSIGGQSQMSVEELEKGERVSPLPVTPVARQESSWWKMAALVAGLAVIGALLLTNRQSKPPEVAATPNATFATLVQAQRCTWGPSRLPTEEGSRLGQGRVRLAQGLAVIQFDNGARLSVEAPADLELATAGRCLLHQGMLIANIPPPAMGFTIETATARLVDHGTEFGVSASSSGDTEVQVLDGIVDVYHRASGSIERLTTGKNSRVSKAGLAAMDIKTFEPMRPNLPAPTEVAPGTITITTAFGAGKDTYVHTEPTNNHSSEVLLLIKNARTESYRRKAYLGFDLSQVSVRNIEDATLVLRMEPTGFGYASMTPACTFTVYGITDESLDDWKESTISWSNAPANLDDGSAVDLTKAVAVGTFEVPEMVTSGEFSISGESLARFLNRDRNGMATFILVRDTKETKPFSLVHGFVSKRHPHGTPPTLRLTMAPAALASAR